MGFQADRPAGVRTPREAKTRRARDLVRTASGLAAPAGIAAAGATSTTASCDRAMSLTVRSAARSQAHPDPADRNENSRSCRLAPCPVFKHEAISPTHTHKDQSQIVRCPGPLPCIVRTPYPEFGAG